MVDDTETQPAVPIASQPPGQVPFIYANVAGTRGGAFDVSIDFGYVVPAAENEPQQPAAWLVRVGMSWEHARALVGLLRKQIDAYEEQVGPLPEIENLRTGEAGP